DDGRFGDNPNRMQKYYQLQVILQPDPGDPQQLYLDSLAAIGIDARRHDIRFVEDNWASPVLGAWGLGWEVWIDGQEVAQFTYFQQAGGINLDPVAVEITYGFERMAAALQAKNSVWDLDYGLGISYGDVLLREEIEHCEYYFNLANVDALHDVYDIYEREAYRCIEAGLVIPAHDYNLKCSHLFNVLDTRGAIGVTERAEYFRRMRNMARDISQLYVKQREEMDHPFLKVWPLPEPAPPPAPENRPHPTTARDFVLEIGTEELPVTDLSDALEQLRKAVPAMLAELRLSFASVNVQGTPRRLAVMVKGLAPRQPDLESVVKGPPAERAFDADGNPTKAAEGFARGRGVAVTDLQVVEEGDKRYVAAVVREDGRNAVDVLAEALPELIAGIKFNRSIRWNQTNISFSRPLRWLLALFGDVIVPFSYADVYSGRVTVGIRPYGSPQLSVAEAEAYAGVMSANKIMLDVAARRDHIFARSAELAAEVGGTIPADPDLLEEVTNLVEMPTPFRGQFEERFLALPAEALVAVMR
ncbi:MAG: glycine--tRNA ligase subunit alpha, partial [Anaerolineales bacterium]|nr:glycine--tRNA ligase subunit alpha [Anaerolineales bacterium]